MKGRGLIPLCTLWNRSGCGHTFFENLPGFFIFFYFFETKQGFTPKKLHRIVLRPKTNGNPCGNSTWFFLDHPWKSTLFIIHPWNLFFHNPWKFHILNFPICLFVCLFVFGIAQLREHWQKTRHEKFYTRVWLYGLWFMSHSEVMTEFFVIVSLFITR